MKTMENQIEKLIDETIEARRCLVAGNNLLAFEHIENVLVELFKLKKEKEKSF